MDRRRPAAHRDPGRHARRERRAVRPRPADRAPRAALEELGLAGVGGRAARTASTPGSAKAGTCCRPGRSSSSRSPGSWSATRTWSSSTRPPRGWTRSPRRRVQRATERLLARPDRHRHRAPALVGAPLRRGRRPGRRRGASRPGPLRTSRAVRPSCWRSSRARRRRGGGGGGGRLDIDDVGRRRRRRRGRVLLPDAYPAEEIANRSPSPGPTCRGRPAAAAAPAARAHAAGDPAPGDATTRGTGWRRSASSWCMSLLGLDGSVLPWLWADLVDGAGGVFWPAAGIVAGAAGDHADARTTPGAWFPRVVGHADAADQPAAGARADRAAPGQRAHPGRGRRAGRGHRAGGRQLADNLSTSSTCVVDHRRDDAGLRERRAGLVLRRRRWLLSGLPRRPCSARCWSAPRSARSRPGRRSPRRWCRRCRRPARSSSPAPPGRCSATWPGWTRGAATGSAREIAMQVWARSTPSLASAGCCRSARGRCTWPAGMSAGADAGRGVDARRGPVVRVDHGVADLAAALGPGVDPAAPWPCPASPRTRRRCRAWTCRRGTAPAPPVAPRHAAAPARPRRLRRRPRGRHARRLATST